jgi:arginine transport system substrate-binding protein
MQGMNVCVEPGSAQESVLATYPFINMLYTERIDDALLYIQTGKADAVLVEPAVAKKFKRRFDTIVSLDLPLAADQQVDGIGIAVKKNNIALIEELTQTITKLKADGIITTAAQTWGLL